MTAVRIFGLALLAAGLLIVAYGGFSYTKTEQEAKLGPLELNVKRQQRVELPIWSGVLVAATGAVLLVWGGRRS